MSQKAVSERMEEAVKLLTLKFATESRVIGTDTRLALSSKIGSLGKKLISGTIEIDFKATGGDIIKVPVSVGTVSANGSKMALGITNIITTSDSRFFARYCQNLASLAISNDRLDSIMCFITPNSADTIEMRDSVPVVVKIVSI